MPKTPHPALVANEPPGPDELLDPTKSNTWYFIKGIAIHFALVMVGIGLIMLIEMSRDIKLPWEIHTIVGAFALFKWLNHDYVKKKENHVRVKEVNGTWQIPCTKNLGKNKYAGMGSVFRLTFGPWEWVSWRDMDVSRRTYEIGTRENPLTHQLGALSDAVSAMSTTEGIKAGVFLADFFITVNAAPNVSPSGWNYLKNGESQAENQMKVTILTLLRDVATFLEGFNTHDAVVQSGFDVLDKRKIVEQLTFGALQLSPWKEELAQTGMWVWILNLRKIVPEKRILDAGEEKAETFLQAPSQIKAAQTLATMAQTLMAGFKGGVVPGAKPTIERKDGKVQIYWTDTFPSADAGKKTWQDTLASTASLLASFWLSKWAVFDQQDKKSRA